MTSQSVQSLRATKTAVFTLVLVSVFLSIVGIHQGLAPHGCFGQRVGPTAIYDGRSCEYAYDCARDGEPGTHYHCERIGLFGTYTINDRVRWLGIIEDPNELAMCVSLCVPLLIGLYQLRPSRWRGLFVLLAAGGFVLCTVYTQSRGGQLVFLTAIGVYFIRRYGMRGALVCALVALPVMLFGGRSGTDAEESKMERLEALLTASDLMLQRPLFGVGFYQFTEYHVRTAHNSYALSAAELGFPGLCLFVAVLYQSMKSFITIARRYSADGPARAAYIWAGALAAAQCGLMVGIFFLSFNASAILWTFFGITSGFQLAVKRHDPALDLSLKLRDAAAITGIALALAVFMYSYSHWKVGGH